MKKRMLALLLALSMALSSLTACTAGERESAAGIDLYYLALEGESAVGAERRPGSVEDMTVAELVGLLLNEPEDAAAYESPFPKGLRLRSWKLDKGSCTLDFTEQYGALSGVSLTLADACLVLTLSQMPQIESVTVKVEGRLSSFRAIQALSVNDLLISDNETAPVSVEHTFCFPSSNERELGTEEREVRRGENDSLLAAVLREYFAGPQAEGLTTLLPEGTQLLDAVVKNGVCYLDLSREFLDDAPLGRSRQRLLIQSLVNTLGGLSHITAVRIRVEGATVETYGGLDLSVPIEPERAQPKTVDGPAQ